MRSSPHSPLVARPKKNLTKLFAENLRQSLKIKEMENIHLGKPYKVSEHKHKQYQKHYEVPIQNCMVVPVKKYGDQISCDLRWKDETGETRQRDDLMFSSAYLLPLDAMKDFKLYDLWEDYTKSISRLDVNP